ncbi:unnamed protein product [Phytophthora fragariaefolia]|uniref:Unnamed protein product n=1 Tax=Phytophthora fragariaefolia TaxID=1490495 RepID=A0A9W6U5Y5_9STRA|nr:unnamed protein product [Phytophthora fragariaefolia]
MQAQPSSVPSTSTKASRGIRARLHNGGAQAPKDQTQVVMAPKPSGQAQESVANLAGDFTQTNQQQLFHTDVGNWLAPTQAEEKERQQRLQSYWTHISPRVTSWIEHEDEWAARLAIILPDDFRNPMDPPPLHIQQAWHTWAWADNPWVPDINKPTVARRTYHRIAVTAMQQLAVSKDFSCAYTVRIPKATPNGRLHRVVTLARWAVAILYAAPSPTALTTGNPQGLVQLCHGSLMEGIYSWHVSTPEIILAVPTTTRHQNNRPYASYKTRTKSTG